MKYLGRFMAILAALLVVVTLPCAVWFLSSAQLLTDADTYKVAFARENVYSDLIPALLPALIEETEQTDAARGDQEALNLLNIVRNLNERDWRIIAEELVPADWLQRQVETNLDGFFNWVNNETPEPRIALDTASLRDRLTGQPGQRAVNLILQSWPDCTQEQVNQLLDYNPDGDAPFVFCKPPGEYIAYMSEFLAETMANEAYHLPDVLPEPGWLDNNRVRSELNQTKQLITVINAMTVEFVLVPLALLALIVFFTVRSSKSFFKWSGATSIFSGIATLLPIPILLSPLLLPSMLNSMGANGAPRPGPGMPLAGGPGGGYSTYAELIIGDIIRTLLAELTLPVLIVGALIIVLGFVAVVIAVIIRYPEERLAEQMIASGLTPPPASLSTYTVPAQGVPTAVYPQSTPPPTTTSFPPGEDDDSSSLPPS